MLAYLSFDLREYNGGNRANERPGKSSEKYDEQALRECGESSLNLRGSKDH